MIAVILIWAALPVVLAGILILTARQMSTRSRVGIAIGWIVTIGLVIPYTLSVFRTGWERTAILWGLVVVGTLSVLWGVILVYPPKARPPSTPSGKGSNFVSAETRTYRMAKKGLWR